MRYTRSIPSERLYLTASAVVMGELFKVCMSTVFLLHGGGSLSEVAANPMELLKTGVPAFLYLVQNNLQYVAVSNLPAATYQVTYQLKILSTALMSVALLRKQITRTKWIALLLLTMGVAAVQLSSMEGSGTSTAEAINMPMGLSATIAACCCSGLAGVYFEKILKGSDVSLWVRNIQLGMYSIVIGMGGIYMTPSVAEKVAENGFFYGYTSTTLFNIAVQGGGGLMIAVVIKYADNILKNFSTAISIIVSSIYSWLFMGFQLSYLFAIGVGLVNYAVWLYGRAPTGNDLLPNKTSPTPAYR
mmetsp:Transcript_4229/g.8779  ORF Transcript_4229/g.8779 Transcript_4229/m.8779 type:complete len:302 (-) Transcript_4229:843-1748(-)